MNRCVSTQRPRSKFPAVQVAQQICLGFVTKEQSGSNPLRYVDGFDGCGGLLVLQTMYFSDWLLVRDVSRDCFVLMIFRPKVWCYFWLLHDFASTPPPLINNSWDFEILSAVEKVHWRWWFVRILCWNALRGGFQNVLCGIIILCWCMTCVVRTKISMLLFSRLLCTLDLTCVKNRKFVPFFSFSEVALPVFISLTSHSVHSLSCRRRRSFAVGSLSLDLIKEHWWWYNVNRGKWRVVQLWRELVAQRNELKWQVWKHRQLRCFLLLKLQTERTLMQQFSERAACSCHWCFFAPGYEQFWSNGGCDDGVRDTFCDHLMLSHSDTLGARNPSATIVTVCVNSCCVQPQQQKQTKKQNHNNDVSFTNRNSRKLKHTTEWV